MDELEERIANLSAKAIGRRRKVFIASPNDIVGGKTTLDEADGTYTAAIIRSTIRRANDPAQAIAEYSRILKPKSPVLIIIRTGLNFREEDARSLIQTHFKELQSEVLTSGPEKTLFAFICKKQ